MTVRTIPDAECGLASGDMEIVYIPRRGHVLMCPCCAGDGLHWIPRLGGNDPDGVEIPCEACQGEGGFHLYLSEAGYQV